MLNSEAGLTVNEVVPYPDHITERQYIEAPPHFVSVFHEITPQAISDIDREGLRQGVGEKNIGRDGAMVKRNKLIDTYLPDGLRARGVSRNNLYAYPFLEHGHGLMGADQRFIARDRKQLMRDFVEAQQMEQSYRSFLDFWRKEGVTTPEAYAERNTDPEYLREKYPGEILELKVDPEESYVGDLEYVTRIMDDVRFGFSEKDAVEKQAREYWGQLMPLKDFLQWYRKPEWTEDGNNIKDADAYRDGEPSLTTAFYPVRGTPEQFPDMIYQPEILIPKNVPQKHIRLVS
jgi:hypothetical protein